MKLLALIFSFAAGWFLSWLVPTLFRRMPFWAPIMGTLVLEIIIALWFREWFATVAIVILLAGFSLSFACIIAARHSGRLEKSQNN